MRIKRILTTLLIALMMFSMVAVTSFAAGEDANASFDIVVDMSSASALADGLVQNTDDGVTVDFTLKIVNNPGVGMLSIRLAYNTDKLELVDSAINTDVFSADKWEWTGVTASENGKIDIDFWTNNMGLTPDTSFTECDFVTFTFKVKGDFDGKVDKNDFVFNRVDVVGAGFADVESKAESVETFEVHHYVAIEDTIKDPTCTEAGKATYKCSVEGCTATEITVETAPALNHDIVPHEAKEPTCTEIGWDAYETCSRCDYTTYVEKAALGHDLPEEWTVTTEPTCTEKGVETKKCSRCDYAETQEIDALGHNLPEEWTVTTEPTCTEKGVETKKCSRCDYTETQDVDALGHNLGEWELTTEPTCTEKGEETKFCSRCDYTETQEVEALGHDYEAVVTDPTCTADGYTTHTCSRCEDTYVDAETEALGHDWGEWKQTTAPTTSAKGENTRECSRCDATETEEIAKLPVMTFASEEWKKGEGLTFISDAEFDAFVKVTINGTDLAKDNYTVTKGENGETVVVLKDEYLETLDAAEYIIEVVSTSGVATSTFEIVASAWWIILIVVAAVLLGGGGVVCVVIFLRKERENA